MTTRITPNFEHAMTVTEYADEIMQMIDEDIEAGTVPGSVRSFADLHDYVDANDYTLTADVPWGGDIATADDPAGVNLVNAVTDEVTRRLAAPSRKFCTYGTCNYKEHDHTTTVDRDGNDLDTPVPMLCNDCGQPTHYDEKTHEYRHDDPNAPSCFLIAMGP